MEDEIVASAVVLGVTLLFNLICGFIAMAIAGKKGRSTVGWFFGGFFLGIVGIVIVAVIQDLKVDSARRNRLERENRRLREQINQERARGDVFQHHTRRRLDVHDGELGVDTREAPALESSPAPAALPSGSGPSRWFYDRNGEAQGPLTEPEILDLIDDGSITETTLLWADGLADWTPARRLEAFRRHVAS